MLPIQKTIHRQVLASCPKNAAWSSLSWWENHTQQVLQDGGAGVVVTEVMVTEAVVTEVVVTVKALVAILPFICVSYPRSPFASSQISNTGNCGWWFLVHFYGFLSVCKQIQVCVSCWVKDTILSIWFCLLHLNVSCISWCYFLTAHVEVTVLLRLLSSSIMLLHGQREVYPVEFHLFVSQAFHSCCVYTLPLHRLWASWHDYKKCLPPKFSWRVIRYITFFLAGWGPFVWQART